MPVLAVGNVRRYRGDRQVGIAAEVMVGQDDLPQVLAIGRRKPVLPIVGARPNCPPPDIGSRLPGCSGWKRMPRFPRRIGFRSGFSGEEIVPPPLPAHA